VIDEVFKTATNDAKGEDEVIEYHGN